MDERLKESISALMDDEANELELQRVLSKADETELLKTWQQYHQIRSVLRSEPHSGLNIDVSASVAAALQTEAFSDDHGSTDDRLEAPIGVHQSADTLASKSTFWGRGLAVAASMVLGVVLVLQYGAKTSVDGQIADRSLGFEEPDQALAIGLAQQTTVSARAPKIIHDFSEAHARRFNEYLLRHAEQSSYGSSQGVIPLARVASVNSVGI